MNIFYFDRDPQECAEQTCDLLLNKMILKTAQLLNTAHYVLDGDKVPSGIYKPTHRYHPCAIWVRASEDHFIAYYPYYKNGKISGYKLRDLRAGQVRL